ncbi:MAG: twin-arginine translocation signal domain-containing protein [Sutterella wadsworthensis]
MQLNRRQFLGSAAAAAALSTAPAVMTAVVQKDQGDDQN